MSKEYIITLLEKDLERLMRCRDDLTFNIRDLKERLKKSQDGLTEYENKLNQIEITIKQVKTHLGDTNEN